MTFEIPVPELLEYREQELYLFNTIYMYVALSCVCFLTKDLFHLLGLWFTWYNICVACMKLQVGSPGPHETDHAGTYMDF